MLATIALARWVGVASQAAFPRPNWSQALKSRTRSRRVAADAGGGLHSPPARARTTTIAHARSREVPVPTDMWPAPRLSARSWLVAAGGDRDPVRSRIDRQPAADSPAVVPRVQRPSASVPFVVPLWPDPEQTAAVRGDRTEILGEAVVHGGSSVRDVDAQGAEARRALRGVTGLLMPDRRQHGGPVG